MKYRIEKSTHDGVFYVQKSNDDGKSWVRNIEYSESALGLINIEYTRRAAKFYIDNMIAWEKADADNPEDYPVEFLCN